MLRTDRPMGGMCGAAPSSASRQTRMWRSDAWGRVAADVGSGVPDCVAGHPSQSRGTVTRYLAFDTETCLIAPYQQVPGLVCGAWSSSGGNDLSDALDTPELLIEELSPRHTNTIVCHFAAFDMAVMCRADTRLMPLIVEAYENDRITCTVLREKLLNIANGRTWEAYGLDDLVKLRFGHRLEKDDTWRLKYGELRYTPIEQWPEEAREYPKGDTAWTYRLAVAQDSDPEAEQYLRDQYRQARADFWLYLTRAWGLRTDQSKVDRLERTLLDEVGGLRTLCQQHGLIRHDRALKSGPRKGQIEPGSRDMKAARARMVEVCTRDGLVIPRTESGDVGLDAFACEDSGDEVLEAYARSTSLAKKLGTEIQLMRAPIVHARFDALKVTGRTGAKQPCVQNQPREKGYRECFVPSRPDWCFISADYGMAELFSWAQSCILLLGFSTQGEALAQRKDVHCISAAASLVRSYEDTIAGKRAGDPEVKIARDAAKVINFGCPGGIGARTLQKGARKQKLLLPLERWTQLRYQWFDLWAEARPYLDLINRETSGAFAQIEHYRSQRVRGGVGFCDGANTRFQGLTADYAKEAGWYIMKACYLDRDSPLYGWRIVNFVHDEFILEGPAEHCHAAATELKRIMLEVANRWLPDAPGIDVEEDAMWYWSKDAKRVTDASGHIIPWGTRQAA